MAVSTVVTNRLQQQLGFAGPSEARVSDITSIRPHEGWLFRPL